MLRKLEFYIEQCKLFTFSFLSPEPCRYNFFYILFQEVTVFKRRQTLYLHSKGEFIETDHLNQTLLLIAIFKHANKI